MAELWIGLIGIFGALLGVTVNELLRRRRRIETYSARVFDKRLATYEELIKRLQAGYEIAADVFENPDYSSEQRHELISVAIHNVASLMDENELYIDSDLAMHCVATFMGAEDVFDIQDIDERNTMKQDIRNMYMNARRMIREDSGIAEIDKHFKKITRPTLSSPVIDHIQYLRKHPEEVQRFREASR